MKSKILFIYTLFVLVPLSFQAQNYGLRFYSHAKPAAQRTQLQLNNGNPFKLNKELSISFYLKLRNEPTFGNIFCAQTNDGQSIDALFTNHDYRNYPALIVNEQIHSIEQSADNLHDEVRVTFSIQKNKQTFTLTFGEKSMTIPARTQDIENIRFTFGINQQRHRQADVAPMDLRDIEVKIDGKPCYHWELKQHNDSVCYDLLQQAPATTRNPHFIMNDHVSWKSLYTLHGAEKVQVAFNPTDNLFYIVQEKEVITFDPATQKQHSQKVKRGHRAMMYSNYLTYVTPRKQLLSYELDKGIHSVFDFEKSQWSLLKAPEDEAHYANHSYAANDSVAYTFGGYGFYHYRNNLFRIHFDDYRIEECIYQSCITPRGLAASALVGDKLYVFGGFGNRSGKQELPCGCYYDLYMIDLEKMTSYKLWEAPATPANDFLLAPTMYFNPQDSSFYAASTELGGTLIKVSLNRPHWEAVSQPVYKHLIFKDMTFRLFQAPQYNKMYLVINKRMNDLKHEVEIYSIDCPLFENNITTQTLSTPWIKGREWVFYLLPILIAAGVFICLYHYKRTSRPATGKFTSPSDTEESSEDTESLRFDENFRNGKNIDNPFIHTPSAIHLLGRFYVIDKEGNDITGQFTPRTKSLLIILLLYSQKYEKGILMRKVDELIWDDKDEENARNNRNVYMRKLRVLLTSVGDIDILNDKTYYRIRLGEGIFFDYQRIINIIGSLPDNRDKDNHPIEETLALLLQGPLLPDTSFEWLDDFKSDYSTMALNYLNNLLGTALRNGLDELALKIAETIFSHDMLSEEALQAQCSILNRKKCIGISRNIYDRFCKEYRRCLNEEYPRSFNEVSSVR